MAMKYLRAGWNAIDIGANVGYYTLLFSRCVGRHGKIYSIEPEPQNLDVLRANVAKSRPDNIDVIAMAFGDETGPGRLYKSRDNLGDHRLAWREGRESCPVELARADDVFAGREDVIHLVKIDVQGAEEKVLRGMRRLIECNAGHLIVFVEFSPNLLLRTGDSARSFIALLDDLRGSALRFRADGAGRITLWPAGRAELKDLAEACLAQGIEDMGKDLILFFSLEAEQRFRQSLLEPWPSALARLWRWSGYA